MSGLTAKRKFLGTVFLRALGLMEKIDLDRMGSDSHLEDEIKRSSFSDAEILRKFYTSERATVKGGHLHFEPSDGLVGLHLAQAVEDRAARSSSKAPGSSPGATLRS